MSNQPHMFNVSSISVSVGGREISFETGKIARQANGSVMVRSGETMLLCTACAASKTDENADFFPLRVDYQEKFSSTGKTLGGFIKREGKPSEREVLISRLIDRPLRPMFMDGYFTEVQVLAFVLSFDGVHATDPLAICGASAALAISDIPLIKPIAAVRVGLINGEFVINPTIQEQEKSTLDLVMAGTDDAILMIEGYCDFLTEEQIQEALEEGHEAIKVICQALADWQKAIGQQKNTDHIRTLAPELLKGVDDLVAKQLATALKIRNKQERNETLSEIQEMVLTHYFPEGEASPKYSKLDVLQAYKKVKSHHMRQMILNENSRIDGRRLNEIRPISVEMGLLPRTHGSALFTRGETQSIAVCTLGGETMGQRYEELTGEGTRKFYLQYNFPPFSVGEVGRMGSPGRREVGHGKLAERALAATIPTANFPYTIRLESNITESNGSSSMASVCGGCLALMEAGVPVKHPVAGIAMGLILEGHQFAILSDILGDEDALGDMDFKIAGNAHGVTAFQLDIKVEGINHNIMQAALMQAKEGRLHILSKMLEACPKPKDQMSQYAPRIETMQVKPSKIGVVIGPSGKTIRAIIEETGCQIDINDSGIVSISSQSQQAMDRAKEIITNLTAEIEIGKVYHGKVVSIVAFGAFVEIYSKEGLLHISEIAHERVDDVNKFLKVGDQIDVKVLDINDRGQIKLSRKVLLTPPQAGG